MPNLVVLGVQWGDEGKGKIVDLVCPAFDLVARFQGGHNAGHTVKFGDRHFALHFLPSGILQPRMRCVLGNGMVVYPEALFEELAKLEQTGIDADGRLFVSDRAQVILPTHIALDRAREAARGAKKIGTTARGIGPTYEGRAARSGLRIGDLGHDDLEDRLGVHLSQVGPQLRALGSEEAFDVAGLADRCREWAQRLAPFVDDTGALLRGALAGGESILFEGAQGTLLDIDHGTYPFVTSSTTLAAGASIGTGVPPQRLDDVLGVLKAYTTRVGGGPFPGELDDDAGEFLRKRGNEFGTSTGRPRRCGWLDAVAARYSQELNGFRALALTKLDVLDDFDEIRICVGYRIDGEERRDFPADVAVLEGAEPVYRTLPGWKTSTVGLLDLADLPVNARAYLDAVEEEVGARVALISTGPRREETLFVDCPELPASIRESLGEIVERRDSGEA